MDCLLAKQKIRNNLNNNTKCEGGRGRENVAGSSRLKESKFAAKKESKSLGLVSV